MIGKVTTQTYYKIKTRFKGFWSFSFFGCHTTLEEAKTFMDTHWPHEDYKVIKCIDEEVYSRIKEDKGE